MVWRPSGSLGGGTTEGPRASAGTFGDDRRHAEGEYGRRQGDRGANGAGVAKGDHGASAGDAPAEEMLPMVAPVEEGLEKGVSDSLLDTEAQMVLLHQQADVSEAGWTGDEMA
jgi:hypothetical protein